MRFYKPSYLINVMRVYNVGSLEAQAYLLNDSNKAFLFSSGEVYVPRSWDKDTKNNNQ